MEITIEQIIRLGRLARGWDFESIDDLEYEIEKILMEIGYDKFGRKL